MNPLDFFRSKPKADQTETEKDKPKAKVSQDVGEQAEGEVKKGTSDDLYGELIDSEPVETAKEQVVKKKNDRYDGWKTKAEAEAAAREAAKREPKNHRDYRREVGLYGLIPRSELTCGSVESSDKISTRLAAEAAAAGQADQGSAHRRGGHPDEIQRERTLDLGRRILAPGQSRGQRQARLGRQQACGL